MTKPNLYICTVQDAEWDFDFEIVCEANLIKHISEGGTFVEKFDRNKITKSEVLGCNIFFTAFSPPEPQDIQDDNWIYRTFVYVMNERQIDGAGGDKLVWIPHGGQWVAYDYDDYLDFVHNVLSEHEDMTLGEYANIQKSIK